MLQIRVLAQIINEGGFVDFLVIPIFYALFVVFGDQGTLRIRIGYV